MLTVLEEETESEKEKNSTEKSAEEKQPNILQAAPTQNEEQPKNAKNEKPSGETTKSKTDTVQRKKEFIPPQSSDGFWD